MLLSNLPGQPVITLGQPQHMMGRLCTRLLRRLTRFPIGRTLQRVMGDCLTLRHELEQYKQGKCGGHRKSWNLSPWRPCGQIGWEELLMELVGWLAMPSAGAIGVVPVLLPVAHWMCVWWTGIWVNWWIVGHWKIFKKLNFNN